MAFGFSKRSFLQSLLMSAAVSFVPSWAKSVRSIAADMTKVSGLRDMAWQDCVGADHPGILLRPANFAQLKLAHDEIGFKYIRFHGIFNDDMEAYREIDGKPVYNFDKIDAVYDAILKIGMKPLVEIGFMPESLASDKRTIFYWKAFGSPPSDWNKWSDFITAFTRHLESRFGAAEIRSWRFEIWNEPNLDGFWTGGDQQSYFKLYDMTVRAIKGVDVKLLVGGPSTAGAAWVPELLAHAKAAGVPVDFVTTHAYGVNAGFFDEKGEGDNKLSPDEGSIVNDVVRVRHQIDASDTPGLPLYFTEWSTSYNPRDPVHDDYLSAPFHGGFGLINREGIRKASFFAYKYLNQLGPQALQGEDKHSLLSCNGDIFSGLFWDYTTPNQTESNRPFYRKLRPATAVAPLDLVVRRLKPGTYMLKVFRTGYKANDAYSHYIEWGRPDNLNPDQVAKLQAFSNDAPEVNEKVSVGPNGVFQKIIPMRTNDVVLVKLVPEEA